MIKYKNLIVPIDIDTVDITLVRLKTKVFTTNEMTRQAACLSSLKSKEMLCKGIECKSCLLFYANRSQFLEYYNSKPRKYGNV